METDVISATFRPGPLYLFLVLIYVFDLGVVYGQVPAVCRVPHAVAAGAQQGGLPLGGHGLKGR